MRFRIDDHPYDRRLRVEYGFDPDPAVGWFVIVYYDDASGEPILTHNAGNCGCVGIEGALGFLEELGFFTSYEAQAAVDALAAPEPLEASEGVRRALTVMRNLRAADPSS